MPETGNHSLVFNFVLSTVLILAVVYVGYRIRAYMRPITAPDTPPAEREEDRDKPFLNESAVGDEQRRTSNALIGGPSFSNRAAAAAWLKETYDAHEEGTPPEPITFVPDPRIHLVETQIAPGTSVQLCDVYPDGVIVDFDTDWIAVFEADFYYTPAAETEE